MRELKKIEALLSHAWSDRKVKKVIIQGCFVVIHISTGLNTWKKSFKGIWRESSEDGFTPYFYNSHMLDKEKVLKYKSIIIYWDGLTVLVIEKNGIMK